MFLNVQHHVHSLQLPADCLFVRDLQLPHPLIGVHGKVELLPEHLDRRFSQQYFNVVRIVLDDVLAVVVARVQVVDFEQSQRAAAVQLRLDHLIVFISALVGDVLDALREHLGRLYELPLFKQSVPVVLALDGLLGAVVHVYRVDLELLLHFRQQGEGLLVPELLHGLLQLYDRLVEHLHLVQRGALLRERPGGVLRGRPGRVFLRVLESLGGLLEALLEFFLF